jgi:enoyl-CoA hydratase/carnithine racemase
MSTTEPLRVESTNRLVTFVLDQPPVNALDGPLSRALLDAAAKIRLSQDARAVILTGGPKVFAAGGDVKEMVTWDYSQAVRESSGLGDACTSIARLPVPVIAAVNGYALGGGLELSLAADLRVCASDARLGFPEILLGLIPGAGGTQRLPRLVGDSRAKDLILTGRTIRADEAMTIGLVDRVVPPEDVLAEARRMAEPFLNGPALAIRAAKTAIDQGREVSLDAGLEIERSLFAGIFATEDRQAGMRSFLEHGLGKAQFRGR